MDSQRYKVDNKYQKAKIKNLEQRVDFQKYNIEKKITKITNYIFGMFAVKNGVFIWGVEQG